MSRSADTALFTTALAACLLAMTASAAAAPAAAPTPSVMAADPHPTAPVVGLTAPVVDIVVTVTNLDGTSSTVDQGPTRRVVLASSVLFAESSPQLSPQALAALAAVARQIRAGGAHGTVTINGYTDDQGSAANGLVLSRRRAAAVTAVLSTRLAGMGLRFVQHGWGESHPIAPNEHSDGTPDRVGQAKNRRVEIVFTPRTAPRSP